MFADGAMVAVRGLFSSSGVKAGANPGVATLVTVLDSSSRSSSQPSRGANDQARRRALGRRRAYANMPQHCSGRWCAIEEDPRRLAWPRRKYVGPTTLDTLR